MTYIGSPDWGRSIGISYTNLVTINSNLTIPASTTRYLTPTGIQATPFFFKVLGGSSIDVAYLVGQGNFRVQLTWPILAGVALNATTKTQDISFNSIRGWIEINHTTQLAIAILTDAAGTTNFNAIVNVGWPAINRPTNVVTANLQGANAFGIANGDTAFSLPPYFGPANLSVQLITNVATNLDARIESRDYLGNLIAYGPVMVGTQVVNGAGAVIPPTVLYLPSLINTLQVGNRTGGVANVSLALNSITQ